MIRVPADEIDILLLDLLQDDIMLNSHPFKELGIRAGLSEDEVLRRLKRLKKDGILRGIVPTLEPGMISPFRSTLVACMVDEESMKKVVAIINEYPEVSHNFRRDHEYNLWFTLAARSREQIDTILSEIREKTGIPAEAMLDLATVKRYKIDVRFPLRSGNDNKRGISHGQD
ncbi:MAG: AsnC family transcriptional regulator [Methanospirillaceae archaeon]|nr:AsnC family transcriptional regulator [Methanospirillaceae archaeon]